MGVKSEDAAKHSAGEAGRRTVDSYPGDSAPLNPHTRLQTHVAETHTRQEGTRPQSTQLDGTRKPQRDSAPRNATGERRSSKRDATVEPNLVGETLGNYRVKEVLGRGGMGRVYLAEHVTLGREVALKLLRPRYAKRRDSVARFFQEARAVNQIRHRNIVDISDFVELPNGRSFIIMELLHGQTLGELHRAQGEISFERLGNMFAQITDALDAAHQHGFVHRDLKPENIYVVKDPNELDGIRVLDFGVAKLLSGPSSDSSGEGDGLQTAAGTVVGTPAYMSPEQASALPVDARTDIYSLGAILYELLAGRQLFSANTFREYAQKHVHEAPIPLRTLPNGRRISEPLDALVLRCLAKRREDRFASMGELRDALIRVFAHEQQIERQLASHGGEVLLPGPEGRPTLTLERPILEARRELRSVPQRGVQRCAKPTPGSAAPSPIPRERSTAHHAGPVRLLRDGRWVVVGAAALGVLGVAVWRVVASAPAASQVVTVEAGAPSGEGGSAAPPPTSSGDWRSQVAHAIVRDDYAQQGRTLDAVAAIAPQATPAHRALAAQLWLVRAYRFGESLESARRNARLALPELGAGLAGAAGSTHAGLFEAMALDHLLAGELAQADERAARALTLAPGDPLAFLYRGWIAAAAGRDKEALELFERTLVAEPAAVAAVYSELRLAVARDDVAQAQRLYGRLTALAPNHVGARLWWSRVARRALPSTTVEQLLEPALRGSTGSPSERVQVLTRLAEARRLGGDLAEAAAHLDEALRLLPRDPGANLARAKLYLRQGKLERAAPLLAALTREPELEPELSFAALLTQVELAVQADRPLEAQEHIARLSPAQRRHPLAQYWAARVNEGAGDPVEGPKAAMRVYQRLMHDAPAQPEPYVRYAEMALERGDRRAARTALEQARRRFLQAPPSDAVDTAALASLQELTAAVLGAAPPRSR